ncbi:MAG: DUF1573 domain-containing protein [Ferruginibacter sp.]
MKKSLLISSVVFLIMTSCDVRTKNKVDITAPEATSETTTASASSETNTAATTTVQIIDSMYNFGNVVEGAIVEFSFRFKNTGANPLVISNASASCGCTVPEKPEAPIKTGEIGVIKVKFDSKGRVGSAYKTVTVLSNANPGFPELALKGEVTATK